MTDRTQHLLLIDAGNTRLKLAHLVQTLSADALPECHAFAAILENELLPFEQVTAWFGGDLGSSLCVITGSNPQQVDRVVESWPSDWPSLSVMLDRFSLPIAIDVEAPERVGMDRLLNGIAANAIRDSGQPAIVIDVGTATTVDAISAEGVFLGGAILAGPELTARALHEYTAVLPHVSLDELTAREPPVIGRNTTEAIRSGLYWGHWQAVWSYCVRMMEPLGVSQAPQTILTGGAASLFVNRLSPAHQYLPHLTLQGLAMAALSKSDSSIDGAV